jgi:hypothetical protein
MRMRRPLLAAVTVTLCFAGAGTALAQEPPEGEAPPQGQGQGDEPQYPPPNEAPPAGYPPPQQPGDNAPMPPLAADARFGAVGQIAISDDARIAIARLSESGAGSNSSLSSYELRPALDYFVAPSLSIGGQVSLAYYSSNGSTQTIIGVMPQVRYDFSLSSLVSIWPRLGIAYTHTSNSFNGPESTSYEVSLDVFVPLVFHPAPHFFIGGGPYLRTDLVSKAESIDAAKRSTSGLMSMLGGYFGGM